MDFIDQIAKFLTDDPDTTSEEISEELSINIPSIIAFLITEDPDLFEDILCEEEEEVAYEGEWVAQMQEKYPFVHQTFRHGRWDKQGVDIFYGEKSAKASAYDKDPETGQTIPIPEGAKPLQIKSGLTGAKKHLEKWHQLPVIGWRIIPVAVGSPKNIDSAILQLEERGWWFDESLHQRKAATDYFDRLIKAARHVAKTKKPLSDQMFELLKYEQPPEAPGYVTWSKKQWRGYLEKLLVSIDEANTILQSYKTQADQYMKSGRGDEGIADAYIEAAKAQVQRIIETIDYTHNGVKFTRFLKINVGEERYQDLMNKLKTLKHEARKIKEKAMGRTQHRAGPGGIGRGKQRSTLQAHPFNPGIPGILPKLTMVGKKGIFQCRTCNHASTDKIHVNPKHASKFATVPGKKGYFCKICALGRTGKNSCKARQG
jgi:hypothetical protein